MSNKTNNEYILTFNQLLKECDTIYHNVAIKVGLSDCAFWILYTLYDNKIYTQSEICDHGFMPRQTVNTALKKLEKDEFLTLEKSKGKVKKYIHLTEKGKNFIEKKIVPVMNAENNAVSAFNASEKEVFLNTFKALIQQLKQEISNVNLENNYEQ